MTEDKYQNFTYTSIFTSDKRTNYVKPPISNLYMHQPTRHFLLLKSYAIDELAFLRHWYIAYNNIEWHPGMPNGPIYVKPNTYGHGEIEKIYEYCTQCADDFIQKKIEGDKDFYLPFYNCDTMLGNCVETCLIITTLFCFGVFLIFNSIVVLILSIVSSITVVLANQYLNRVPQYESCPHILLNI